MADIHSFNHAAMATAFQVRIADEDQAYAAQAAQDAFRLVDRLEGRLSRFRADSDMARARELRPGETMRLSEPAFACLEIAKRMEQATRNAFCATPAALMTQPALPKWTLLPDNHSILCEGGRLEFDLGAIGKGFALDRMAELLGNWDCSSFLLVAGGSSILAGAAASDTPGWSCGLGDEGSSLRFFLTQASLSGSGLAVKGAHIFDPRTGGLAPRQHRAWALADRAAESDPLSTACMVLSEPELEQVLDQDPTWLAFLETDSGVDPRGRRTLPIQA